jgi:hypothetical protein
LDPTINVLANPPGGGKVLLAGEHGLAPLAGPQPLGDAVDEQIDDGVAREIAFAEVLDSAHSRSVISLTAARDKSRLPVSSVNASSMSHVDRPRVKLGRQPLEFPRAPVQRCPHN